MTENECADAGNEPIEAKLIAACADGGRVNVTPEKWERVRSLVDSYANALVAAAGEACAKHIPDMTEGIDACGDHAIWIVCRNCGWGKAGDKSIGEWAEHIRAVTPEAAAKELERIKTEARTSMFDEFWDYIAAHYAVPTGKYTPAELIQKLASIIQIEARLEGAEEAARLIECTCNKKTLPEDLCYVHSYIAKQRAELEAAKEK